MKKDSPELRHWHLPRIYSDVQANEFRREIMKMPNPKILRLTLCRKWFDMFADGTKDEEYREIKPFWISRLIVKNSSQFKQFDYVEFTNGYGKHRPRLMFECEGIRIGPGHEEIGGNPHCNQFVITVGAEVTRVNFDKL